VDFDFGLDLTLCHFGPSSLAPYSMPPYGTRQ
jgi:hypothetical protein